MLLVLTACTTLEPTWIESPACANEPYAWSDDLASWVSQGDGQGAFSVDPPGDAATSVDGAYDYSTGDFAWTRSYGEDYWQTSVEVQSGVGTVFHNGDLSVEYVTVTTDRLDETWQEGWRVERVECAQEWWVWDATSDAPTYSHYQGAWSADVFEWAGLDELEGRSGTRAPDGSGTLHDESGTDEQDFTFRADGTSLREFDLSDTNYTYRGSDETAWNGDVTQQYTILDGKQELCEVEAEFQYDGDGTATYDCDGEVFTCEYDVRAGDCTYSCDDGSEGDC